MIRLREPLRVCHLVSGDTWGGLEAMVMNLVRAQHADSAYDVSLITLNDGRLYRDAMAAGIAVHLLPENELGMWELVRHLRRVITSWGVELLHTHRYKENLLACLIAPGLGVRTVVTLHGYGPSSFTPAGIKTFVRDRISFRLAQRARTQFVAVSRDLQRLYRPDDDRCITIPNGVGTAASRARGMRRDVPPVVGWVGRLVPIKALGTLLDAVSLMGSERDGPSLLLVGDGPERSTLVDHARRLRLQARIEFTGYVDDPAPFFARMDVFALPSLHEGTPMALLEAMAAGVPCVVARVGGIPDMIGESGAAQLVDGQHPSVWADALTRTLADRHATAGMVQRARDLVAEKFSVEAMHSRYGELYYAVMAQ